MNATISGFERMWLEFKAFGPALAVILHGMLFLYVVGMGFCEGNGAVGLGVVCWLVFMVALYGPLYEPSRARKLLSYLFFFLFLLSPCLHFGGGGKVWIADGKTTISSPMLFRMPIGLPRSVEMKQDLAISVAARTKDGKPIRANVSAAFRLTEDENLILSLFGSSSNPDEEIKQALSARLAHAFAKAVGAKDLSELSNTLVIEFDTGDSLDVDRLGIRRSGVIAVSGLQVYFVD